MEFSFMNLYLLKNIRILYNFYMSSSWNIHVIYVNY